MDNLISKASITHFLTHNKHKDTPSGELNPHATNIKSRICVESTQEHIYILFKLQFERVFERLETCPPEGIQKSRSSFLSLALNFFPPGWNTGSQFRVASKFSHFKGPVLPPSLPLKGNSCCSPEVQQPESGQRGLGWKGSLQPTWGAFIQRKASRFTSPMNGLSVFESRR